MSSHHKCYFADRNTCSLFSSFVCQTHFIESCLFDLNWLFFANHLCLIWAAPFPVMKKLYMQKLNISSSNVITVITRSLFSLKAFTIRYLNPCCTLSLFAPWFKTNYEIYFAPLLYWHFATYATFFDYIVQNSDTIFVFFF